MVLALIQSVTGDMSTTDEPTYDVTTDEPTDDVFEKPRAVICAKSDISSPVSPARHPTSDLDAIIQDCKAHAEHNTGLGSGGNMEKIISEKGLPNNQAKDETAIISEINGNKSSTISDHVEQRPVDISLHQADESQPSMEQNPSPVEHSNRGMDIDFGNQVVVTADNLCTGIEHISEYEGSDAPKSSSRSPLEKLESSAENNLQTFNCESTCAAKSGILVSKSDENGNKAQGNEMMLLCDKNLPVLHSPCDNRIHTTITIGKEESLSDEDVNASLSKVENHSRFSGESCHSAELFTIGKKRRSFQQQLTVGSKRVKQETSHPKSFVQKDSSFMNVVSNMMKGFSQSTPDEGKSLALTIANHDHHPLCPDQQLITCNKNEDPDEQNTGSKSNFHSTYCPSLKNVGSRNYHQLGEASKDFDLNSKVHGIHVTQLNCCAEKSSLFKQYFQSNRFELSTQRYDAGPSLQPKVRPTNFIKSHENWKNDSKTESCYHMELSKEKEGMTQHSCSTRQNKNNNDNVDSYKLSERKETTIYHKRDNVEGQWISRFFPKSSTTPFMIFDHLHEICGSQLQSTDFSTLPRSHKRISYLKNCKTEAREQSANHLLLTEAKKLQNCSMNEEASSTGLKDDKGNNDHLSRQNFNPTTPFPVFGDSDAMASMFARRLGAIRHMPTNKADSIPQRKTSSMVVHHLSSWC
ncbi:hypothetical protein RIF29_21497 [Crotalaria pallida]|uniref:Uncharacterized protein n=1 Tax=Crotalaria pallida TaxID=3830 RepID=A0AAN9FBM1_CROPI